MFFKYKETLRLLFHKPNSFMSVPMNVLRLEHYLYSHILKLHQLPNMWSRKEVTVSAKLLYQSDA